MIKGTRRSEKTTTVTTTDQQSHRQTKGNHKETKETNKSDESESEEEEGVESRPQTHEPLAEGNTAGPYGAVAGSPVTTWAWLLLPPVGAGEMREREE